MPPYSLTNILSLDERERGFLSISAPSGVIGFKAFPRDFFPQTQTGKSGGHVHGFCAFANAVLTILSSRLWKVMTQILPPLFISGIIPSSRSRICFNSSLTSILIA